MSRIERLIAELCPDGVGFKPLGDVCQVLNGYAFKSGLFNTDGEGLPLVRIRDINTGFSETYYSGEFDDRYVVEDGDVLIGMDGDFRAIRWLNGRALLNQRVCRLQDFSPAVLREFVYYYIPRELARIQQATQQSTVKHLSSKELVRARLAVPPIEIQREIVRILDTFTSLEAELEAELEARRRQYEHYRDSLLSFERERERRVRWMTLGDTCLNVSSGGTPLVGRSAYYEGGTIPWLRTQEVRFADIRETAVKITDKAVDETSAKWIPVNCVIVAISGATAGRSAVNKIPLTTNQHCCNLEIDPATASYRYVFHWVSSRYEALKALGQGARSDLNAGLIRRFPIALPPLAEQERIVSILDHFDALVNDLSIGLPAELNARRKQYEHYRDRLLTFEPAAA